MLATVIMIQTVCNFGQNPRLELAGVLFPREYIRDFYVTQNALRNCDHVTEETDAIATNGVVPLFC